MTTYEHEVHLVIKFKSTRKIRSRAELIRIAEELEASKLNVHIDGIHYADRREREVFKRNRVIKETE